MGTLKDDRKLATALLKSGDNEQVIKLLKDHITAENPDYLVLCFAALAYSNLEDYENSYKIYKKAVFVDKSAQIAWKGAFKLFENDSKVNPEEFSLEICDFVENLGDEKSPIASKVRRRLLVELKNWPKIMENFEKFKFHSDSEALVSILKSSGASDLLKTCYVALNSEFPQILEKDGELLLGWAKLTSSTEENNENTIKIIEKLAISHPEHLDEDWIQKTLLEHVCIEYFEKDRFPKLAELVKKGAESTLRVLEALRANDIPMAQEALDAVENRELYPDCLLFVKLLAESENWEQVDAICTLSSTPTSRGWRARSLFAMNDIDSVGRLSDLRLPEFIEEHLKIEIVLENDQEVENIIKLHPHLDLVRVLMSELPEDAPQARHLELADTLPRDNPHDLVVAAEIKGKMGIDANSLLVKAAKLNVRCSRAFFLLGKSLSSKNANKAKSLLERAVSIRPGNVEYVKLLDELNVKLGVPAEDRIAVFRALLANKRHRYKPYWLCHRLAELYLELGNLSEAIDELQQLVRVHKTDKSAWAKLADAYTRKGHLKAAVNSYGELAEMENGHEFVIPMIRVLLQLREFDEALLKCTELRLKMEHLECCSDSPVILDLTEAEIRLNLHETTTGDPKRAHLKEALRLLTRNIDSEGSSKFSSVFKLLGDALMLVAKYSPRLLSYFEVEKNWQVESPLDAISKAVAFYMTVLRFNQQNALGWYDVAIGLLEKFKAEPKKSPELLEKVEKILKHSMTLTSSETLLSSIWTLLSETQRLAEQPVNHQLHCLSRALELNKANDGAWLKVAVLCIEVGLIHEASKVLEQCIKYNPHNADAWCTWAQHAHLQGERHEAMAMFRQALCIKPTPAAVIGYSSYLCESLKKMNCRFDSATAALDFEPVIDLRHQFPTSNPTDDDQLLFHLGLLADLFGWYPESLECFELCQNLPVAVEIQRATLKTSILHPELEIPMPESSEIMAENSRLFGMLGHDAKDSFAFLTGEMEIYNDLYELIEQKEHETFRELYMKVVKGLSVPLFVAGLIVNNIDLPTEFVRTLHDALPRHELIDYYPTVLPDGMDDGLRHLEQDGEEPFRYRHRTAKKLLDELRVLREKADEERAANKVVNKEEEEFEMLNL